MIIYRITNLFNGKVYIGQTIRSAKWRFTRHLASARMGEKSLICNAIRKYGRENFDVRPIAYASTLKQLDVLEKERIISEHASDRLYGYNIREGGNRGFTNRGWKHTPEAILRIGAASKGNKYALGAKIPKSQEWREKVSKANRGSGHGRSKLTEEQVLEIRRLASLGTSRKELSVKFSIGPQMLSFIINRKNWTHI
jgi:group I intron endonuclease